MPSDTTGKGAAFRAYLAKKRPLIEAYLSEHAPAPLGDETVVGDDLERYLYPMQSRTACSVYNLLNKNHSLLMLV